MAEKKELKITERLIRLSEVKEIRRFESFIKIHYFGNEKINLEYVEYPSDDLAERYFDKYVYDKLRSTTNEKTYEWLLVSNNPSLLD